MYKRQIIYCSDLRLFTIATYLQTLTVDYHFLSYRTKCIQSVSYTHLDVYKRQAYFQGKKELFAGLAVERLEKDWIKYPILHLDLNIEKYDTLELSLIHI